MKIKITCALRRDKLKKKEKKSSNLLIANLRLAFQPIAVNVSGWLKAH